MEMIERLRPDVVLLDLSMPQMTGYDIAEELLQNSDLKPRCLIAVTGYGQQDDRAKTALAGFDYHLLKPIVWEELETILERHCLPHSLQESDYDNRQ
jgi:CheY-like chemotaxis protein